MDGSVTDQDDSTNRAAGAGSASRKSELYVWLGLGFFFLVVIVGALVVRRILRSSYNSEVCYQGLQADQIVAKIKE
ncbi:MAG TPA: hypothetical protein VNL14_04080 [Candidatus Acidoferrales bacterium]|nr:hypothetical protein [Candidatus Acidoferrales bacterium]